MKSRNKRVLLLISPHSYRTQAFLNAADRLQLDVAQAHDMPEALAREWGVELAVEFNKPAKATDTLINWIQENPVAAVLSLDDSATVIASHVSAAIGLPNNSPDAALAARDKWIMRQNLHSHGVPAPAAARFELTTRPETIADDITFPCVVKPNLLSGSRGVIRADNSDEFIDAFQRTRSILENDGFTNQTAGIVVEDYVPGHEVAVEGLLTNGQLNILAVFDKPDPLIGPFFEETIYTTPSRHAESIQGAIHDCTERASAALGLREGPVHAELRINDDGPWIIEIAGRSIGGMCSTILEFGTGQSLEELILRHAIGDPIETFRRREDAVGVMMIPIPAAGTLKRINGVEEASMVQGVTGIEISARINHRLVPLPEGASYLGFIFAQGYSAEHVETALREAHSKLRFDVAKQIIMCPGV